MLKILKIAEFIFLYLAIPFIVIYTEDHLHLLLTLWLIVIVVSSFGLYATRDDERPFFTRFPELWVFKPITWRWQKVFRLLTPFGLTTGCLVYWLYEYWPSQLWQLPDGVPYWTLMFYPIASVIPQQLIYNFYLKRRYVDWWKQHPQLLHPVTGFLFALGHIVFWHPFPVLAAFMIGWLFSWRYQRMQSIRLVVLEHSLYGIMVFIVGLGIYFDSSLV